MIESSLSDTVRWVASSGYVADDNGSGLEVEMPQDLYLSQLCVFLCFCVFSVLLCWCNCSAIPKRAVQ